MERNCHDRELIKRSLIERKHLFRALVTHGITIVFSYSFGSADCSESDQCQKVLKYTAIVIEIMPPRYLFIHDASTSRIVSLFHSSASIKFFHRSFSFLSDSMFFCRFLLSCWGCSVESSNFSICQREKIS